MKQGFKQQGPVVQSWVSTNSGLKSQCFSFCVSTYPFILKLYKPKLLLIKTRFLKISQYYQATGNFGKKFYVNPGLKIYFFVKHEN